MRFRASRVAPCSFALENYPFEPRAGLGTPTRREGIPLFRPLNPNRGQPSSILPVRYRLAKSCKAARCKATHMLASALKSIWPTAVLRTGSARVTATHTVTILIRNLSVRQLDRGSARTCLPRPDSHRPSTPLIRVTQPGQFSRLVSLLSTIVIK